MFYSFKHQGTLNCCHLVSAGGGVSLQTQGTETVTRWVSVMGFLLSKGTLHKSKWNSVIRSTFSSTICSSACHNPVCYVSCYHTATHDKKTPPRVIFLSRCMVKMLIYMCLIMVYRTGLNTEYRKVTLISNGLSKVVSFKDCGKNWQ